MKRRRLIRITVSDETRLVQKWSWLMTPWKLMMILLAVSLLLMGTGAAIIFLSPARRLLPGFMGEEQRAASEMAFLRLDSLNKVVDLNRIYIENLREVLDTNRTPDAVPIQEAVLSTRGINADSLLAPTENEERFVTAVSRLDRFRMSVLAPLDAEGMIFYFPASEGIYGQHPADAAVARVILASGATVRAVADGIVIGVSRSVRERGYVIWIQHSNGFVSRYSRLGIPLVDEGSRVEGGEAIAMPARNMATRGELVDVRLWHNGEPLAARKFLPEPQ